MAGTVIEFGGVRYTCTLSDKFRRHSADELERMRESVRAAGVRVAVRVYHDTDRDLPDCVLDGEGRLTVAVALGLEPKGVPFYRESAMSTDAAYQLAKTLNDCRRHDDAEAIRKRRAERIERVAVARSEGESLRAIAGKEGVSPEQVRQDLRAATVKGLTVENPLKIAGLDGREYAATRPAPVADGPSAVSEADDGAEVETDEGGEEDPEPAARLAPDREYPAARPAWMKPGNNADPDHPFADVLKSMTALTKSLNKALAADDSGKLRDYLSYLSKCKVQVRMVLHTGAGFRDGAAVPASAKFVGLHPLRAVVRLAGKDKRKRAAEGVLKEYAEACGAADATLVVEEYDE